ncbi:transglycosylase domain-containing protein [Jeotgalicoccus halotolerans]|uniref:Penicillin-binding protein 1A n=1 Tax=Jeotgalicoccus halotolerans TaxID=157227 RepID=A0A3E0B0U6_9STAP|nr:transglycosylase domain-containing protein [Jeotgalicoccus halotolerans]REG25594.1 penicillin-binding protein 1A [Jeotgalicoccus halotolerans]
MESNFKRSKQSGAKSEQKKQSKSKSSIIKKVFLYAALLALIGLVIGAVLFAYYASQAPAFSDEKLKDPVPAEIYDQNDELVTTLFQGQKREYVSIEDVPAHVSDAVLAIEDNRFYDHGAIDFIRLGGAVISNFTDGFASQGASTITQQVVKRAFLTEEQTIERKAQEAYLSYRLEQEYSKDDILEMYLNKIYYSDGIYGIRTASLYYFDKELADLNIAESAYLAGLSNLPNVYNLYEDSEAAKSRTDTVLYMMLEHERITQEEYDEAMNIDITENLVARDEAERFSTEQENPEYASYINYIKTELQSHDEFRNRDISEVLSSGIQIYTNMDSNVQSYLQNMTNNRNYYYNDKFRSDDFNIASTILDTSTGGLVAISGGRDYQEVVDQNLALTQHNVGSTMKPFLAYGPAIEHMEWATNQTIQDEQSYTPKDSPNNTVYNYDNQGHGNVTMRDALRQSFNVPAVKAFEAVQEEAGYNAPAEFAAEAGLDYSTKNEGDYTVSFNDVLGGGESRFSPLQMAQAYATLGNNGEFNEAQSIRYIVTAEGDKIEFDNETHEAMKDSTAFMLTDMLKDTFENQGSADYIQMNSLNIAAKTGTTSLDTSILEENNLPSNSAKDAWIVGYTPEYTMSVWTGFDNASAGYSEDKVFVGTDEHITPQWFFKDIMQYISTFNGQDFEQPDSVEQINGNEFRVAGGGGFFNNGGSNNNNSNNNGSNNSSNGNDSGGSTGGTWSWEYNEDGEIETEGDVPDSELPDDAELAEPESSSENEDPAPEEDEPAADEDAATEPSGTTEDAEQAEDEAADEE